MIEQKLSIIFPAKMKNWLLYQAASQYRARPLPSKLMALDEAHTCSQFLPFCFGLHALIG
jgi:hypothetical protein